MQGFKSVNKRTIFVSATSVEDRTVCVQLACGVLDRSLQNLCDFYGAVNISDFLVSTSADDQINLIGSSQLSHCLCNVGESLLNSLI